VFAQSVGKSNPISTTSLELGPPETVPLPIATPGITVPIMGIFYTSTRSTWNKPKNSTGEAAKIMPSAKIDKKL
jgi:hypothetical protein